MIETTLKLADGRSLGLAEWGPPDAPVVVYCHGFPGSRLEASLAQPVVEQRGVNARVIAIDRPGYGRSTLHRGRAFLDWPADVAEAADRLGIDRFSALGASGGCPYALAYASVLGERVTRVGVVAGVGPLKATGMPETQLISGPSRVRALRKLQWRLLARYEGELYRQPWGFDPADITTETNLWHGAADQWVPISTARWLADRFPISHLTEWPDHGHFSLAGADEPADVVAVTAGVPTGPNQ